MKILALGGSIRSNPNASTLVEDLVKSSSDLADFKKNAAKCATPGKPKYITNSEVCAAASLLGAQQSGAEIGYFSLASLFPRLVKPAHSFSASEYGLHDNILFYDFLDLDKERVRALIDQVKASDGVILASPVYFGDRSSVSNKLMQLALQHGFLKGKPMATVSVGAKRNGGQETTNVFHLNEARQLGALIVGNGPKTSQYGGTVVGGDVGSSLFDEWGLETCIGTGKRLSQVASLLGTRPSPTAKPAKVLVLVSMDHPDRRLARTTREIAVEAAKAEGVEIEIVELLDTQVDRCLACSICPIPEYVDQNDSYSCIIRTKRDNMDALHAKLKTASGVVVAGLMTPDVKEVMYRYQAFTERTRFIRRNDFELTNVPFTSFLLNEGVSTFDVNFHLKVMCSYMRHNTIILDPITHTKVGGAVVLDATPRFIHFCRSVKELNSRRQNQSGIEVQYQAGGTGGYEDTRLDHTKRKRK